MSVFEPLLPRRSEDDLLSQEPLSPTFSPLRPESQPRLATPMVSDMGEPPEPVGLSGDFSALVDEFRETATAERKPSFRDNALHRKGVNWATPEPEGDHPYQSNPGFYELDYDPRGKHGVELGKGSAYVEAANVFGRQFNRTELERDSEGRKLLKLMEAQRTGAHQEAGFWKGLSDWNLGNTPWLGWMMDIGSTVSETVAISKAMRKMQNGEAVTDHEAIAVRRFMLQQELEGQRSTAYQIGSTIRSSIPFVVEIAGATAMTAAAAKVGSIVGGAIAGIGSGGVLAPVGMAVGAAIGAVGGFIFGGGRLLSKALTGAGKKAMTKVATNATLKELAEKTVEQGITRAERKLATKIAAESTGVAAKDVAKTALQSGRARALEAIGRDLVAANPALASAAKEWTADQFAAYAAKNATTKEIRKRTLFEASKWTAESFKDVADIAMDTKMARQFLVNKDTVNLVEQGWVASLERAVLGKSATKTGAKEAEEGFFASFKNYRKERASIRQNIDSLTPERILEMKRAYLGATMDKALGRPSAQSAVAASISQSLGGAPVHKGYADEVAEALVDNATRSFMMKYRGKGFVNGAHRLARWVGDGILDGMLRWDTSIFHGAGTMARSGSVLGGRMAAMKEALKASFVEAPVRGAMQLGVQIPTWPVISMAAGNAPGDFVVRGQLGTQLTALQTGDREMMDNAWAIAIGSGLVEYISESAGRGFNIFAEGVAAPCLKNAPFVKMTKEVGSYMSRKLESVFGTAEMMKAANKTKLADAVARHIGQKSTELLEKTGQALPAISKDEIMRVVSGAKGIGKMGDILQRLGLRSEKDLIKDAMVSQLDMTRRRAGIAYFVAHNMLEKGWTPQKMAQWMQSVGYDGVISEMMEERYGGFFQGLLGLDDSPSDATARDRWSAAMKGLFPDPHQLLVEAASFSFPALTQLSMNHMYSRLGAGIVSEVNDAARTVSHGMRTVPAYTMPVASEEGAKALADYQAKARELYEKATVGEGGEEAARATIAGRAQAVKSGLADGSLALDKKVNGDISNKDVSDGEMEKLLQEKAQRIIDLSNTSEELEAQLKRHQADLVFGKDGAEAIRRIWRKDSSHMDSVKEQALGKGSEYARHVENVPTLDLRKDADVGSVASEITATLPFVANDAAMTAEVRERLSVQEGVQVNEFSEDYAGDVARNLGTLGDKWLEFKYNLGKHQWWGRRALMRATGILDAITTGNLELAARNPVQWAVEEAQLPKQLMSDVGQLRERSVQAGREIYLRRRLGAGEMTADEVAAARARPLADEDLDLLEEFKKAGEESYRTSLREYAQLFLTARNVIAVSRGDIEDAALRVVAHDHREEVGGKVIYRYGDKTTEDFRSQEFRAAVAKEIAPKRDEIVKALARLAASDAVAINTHSRFGNVNTTSITFSYDRAMRYGNTDEVVAAIRSMPAFRNMRAVYDISDGGHVTDSALGRVLDVGELLRMPADGNLDAGSLRRVMFAMGRYYDQFTEEQNQQAAQQYLTRMRLAVENTEPLSFEFRDGTEAKVTTEYGVDDKGDKVVTLSVNGVSVTAANVYEATKLLEEVRVAKDDGTVPEADVQMPDGTVQRKAGVLANWRQVAILQNDSISSRDATSLALLLHGTRERAREAYERFYGVDGDKKNQVPEELYPPQLRRVYRDKKWTWQYGDDELVSRKLAEELRSNEEGVRAFVRGNGVEGDPLAVGYERAAELMLERYGITRSKQDAAATDVYRGEASYSIRPNGIAFGDTVYLQSDYYSGGDSEMLLRSAFARAIFDAATKKGKVSMPPSEFVGVMQEMDRAFTKAAEEAIAELQDKRPDLAQRLRDAMDSLPSDPGRVSPARMGAIAAAVAVFSDERGANEFGNGFLFGPELAYIADRARLSPWTQLFISTMDEALGGYGFFAKDKPPMAGIRRYIDAFAPSGKDLVRSRSTALFSGGNEVGKKEGIVFQGYGIPADISAAGLASGVSPVLGDDSRTRYKEVEAVNVPLMIGEVAANCRAFAEAYEKAGGTLDNATMYRMLKHALDEGGETAESGAAPSIGSGFGGTSIDLNPQVRAPLSSEVIPDDVAYGLGRGLQFLSPALFGNPAGGVGGRRQASRSRAAVRQFLFDRGVYDDNVERIWAQFMNAAGAETVADADAVDAAMDEAEWNELAEALSEGSGNQDIFFDAKRQNAAIENKDLMELGRQWRFVFPSEGGAFTQIVARLFNEVSRLSAQEGAPQEMKDLSALFNVLRSPRKGKRAGDRIAAATGVWNDSSHVPADLKNTDYVLAKAVAWLHGAGHDDLALVLNGIRNIPAKGKRRAQALALIGYMSPLDTNFVSVGYDGLGSLDTFGSANLAAVSSTRATVTHMLSRVFPYRMGGKASTSSGLMNCVSALDNLLLATGTEEWLAKAAPGTPFEGKTIAGLEAILKRASEGGAEVGAFRNNLADDDILVAFANVLARRLSAVADAVDYVLGPDNELTYALRNPDLVSGVVQSVRRASGETRQLVANRLLELADACVASEKLKSRCPLLSNALLNPAIACIQIAAENKGGRPSVSGKQYKDIEANGLTAANLYDAVRKDDALSRILARTDIQPQGRPRSKWMPNKLPGGVVNSLVGRVFGMYAASAPRSVARMNGVRSENIEDSSQVTAVPASPAVMAAAIEDRLLAKLPLADAPVAQEPDGLSSSELAGLGSGFVNHSGGALGSDSAWGDIGSAFGVESRHYFKDSTPKGNVKITQAQYEEGLQKVREAVGPLGRRLPESKPYVMGLLSRNWQQVKNADAVFAIAEGLDASGNVQGGTGWAVQMAKAEGKPIHVFDQGQRTWLTWTGSAWISEDTPALTKNFAGIGTRQLTDVGRQAIESAYRRTFGLTRGRNGQLFRRSSSRKPVERQTSVAGESSVLDDYLARGGRFLDGSRLVVATAGAKLEDGTVVDKAHLSVAVARANMARFERGDSRNGYFELYHGEKPTVYSVSLPKSVMQKILDGIHSGAEWATNKVVKDLLAKGLVPEDIDSEENRGHMYDALFSVVASAARCDQIESKRTQVLMAQGVPFSTYRDTVARVVDGNLKVEDAAVTAMDGKTRVAPGLYCDILVSGTDAAQNLGMYLNHGLLIEAQRAQATNPMAVSFKNHLIDWFGSGLFKGQGHDPGIGMHETDVVPVAGTIAEALRIQRRELEETLGIKEGTLDLPEDPESMTDEEKAYRESAVRLAEAFFRSSTTLCTDVETLKSGPFSTRCGFRYDLGKPFVVKAGGKELAFTFTKGRLSVTVDGNETDLSDKVVVPEDKAGLSLATMLPAIAYALGKKELTAEDVGSIEAEWKLPDGNSTEAKPLKDSGLFQSYGAELGDKVSVVSNANGGFRVKFFTRSMNGQVMANSDASSKPTNEHPAATNWARDLVANSGRLRRYVPGQAEFCWTGVRAINVARSLPYVALMAQPGYFESRIKADRDLYAAWKAHPNSQDVQEQLVRRANNMFAKAMKPYVGSMHAVLMGSGIKASTSRNADGTYDVEYSYSAGVTDYDRDCFRDARVFTQEEKEAFGVGRSYASGQVNVDSRTFRYGWHLADDADMSPVVKFVDGSERWRGRYEENLARLFWAAYGQSRAGNTDAEKIAWFKATYGPASEDMKTVAYLATYIEYFDELKGPRREAAAKVLGRLFTDYTGKHVGDNASCDLMKVSFSDLFLGKRFGGKRRFDLAAFEFTGKHGKKVDRNGNSTIYLGGAFFAGDRRPSGNFEAAGGLIRVQSPVLFDRTSGRVDSHALYILPPLMNSSQGSDTDGDSATGTVMVGRGFSDEDRAVVEAWNETLVAATKQMGPVAGEKLARGRAAADALQKLMDRYPDYFEEQEVDGETVVLPSAKFHQLIGNVLLQEEIDNYRLMPNETQTETFGLRDVNKEQGGREVVYDFGLVGRSPVGTQAVSDDVAFDPNGGAAEVARSVLGKDADLSGSYYKVFKKCIDRLSKSTIPDLELLDPRVAAYLSGCAADANGARGVMVSLQAALEHLAGYADVDPRIRQLAPALLEDRDGYRPLEDFIGHLDKISNALFDVVKDLFAPRAGWQKGLLNLLVARLVSRANEAYEADRDARFGDEWFFAELVGFAKDLHASDTSLPSLVAKANAFYDHGDQDRFDPARPKQTLLGAYNTMVRGNGQNVAHTAFLQVLPIKDGKVKTNAKGQVKSCSEQAKVVKGLQVKDKKSGEFVGARGDDVRKSISGLLNEIARSLRMTREDFASDEDYNNAVAMGWRPASDLFPAGMADRIADVLQGKVDGRTATTGRAEKLAVGMRFLAADSLEAGLREAEKSLREMQVLYDLQLVEDGLSPDTSLQRGGTRASGLVDKMDASAEQGAALGNQMAETYASSRMRLEDAASERNPLASDRSVSRDLDAVESAAKGNSDWTAYLMRTGQRPLATMNSEGWPENDGALLFMMAAGMAADYPSTGDIQANRLNLSHLLGCVRSGVQKFGSVQYGQLVGRKFRDFASALNDLVEEALNNGTAKGMSKNVVDMLTMLRPNVRQNTVSLALRASVDAAKVLQAGFAELAANKNPVGGGFSGAELAACIQLSMCANNQFDPAKDSDVRANVSAMFGREVDEWERWGVAVSQSPVLRQLCRIERGANGYDLFHMSVEDYFDKGLARKVAKLSGMPGVATRHYEFALKYLRTPFDILRYVASSEYLPEHDAYKEADASDPAFLPGGDQYRRVTSIYAEGEEHKLKPQTSIPGVAFKGVSREFGTLEEAVNDRISLAWCFYKTDKRTAMQLVDPRNQTEEFNKAFDGWVDSVPMLDNPAGLTRSFNDTRPYRRSFVDEADREMYEATGVIPPGMQETRLTLNFNEIADEVLERAWEDYGEGFSDWVKKAVFDGGETIGGIASPWARARLGRFVQRRVDRGFLASPSIGQPDAAANAPFMVARMERGGFFEFLKDKHPEDAGRFVANPEANIRAALEHVFGDWSKETGCKVDRVKGEGGVPLNLLKVTRKVKDKNGVHEVATYVSFGDYLPMKAANMAYRQAILDELNRGAGQNMTMEQFMSLTEEEQVALANSLGMRVKGESVPGGEVAARGLNTRALMALSGLVRLSDVSDYHTLFHEYFHQMLDFYRKTGVCTEEDMAELLKKYRTDDGRFDEEAAADAFANYVTLGDAVILRGKLLSSGFGGDLDRVFSKFQKTAQAFLSGAMAYDSLNVPVFMKMVISADFSDREMAQAKELAEEDSRTLERMLLGEDVAFGSPHNWERAEGELAQDMTDLARAAVGFRQGTHSIDEVKALAAKFVEDGKKPANHVTFEAMTNIDRPTLAGTKACDASGAPIVVYHGSKQRIDKFKNLNGYGNWFTTKRSQAVHFSWKSIGEPRNPDGTPDYTGTTTGAYHLIVHNPKVYESTARTTTILETNAEILAKMRGEHVSPKGATRSHKVDPWYLFAEEFASITGFTGKPWDAPADVAARFSEALKRQGYDGFVLRSTEIDDESEDQWVVFDPEQIVEAETPKPEPGPTLAQRISDPSVPVGDRVSLLFKEALDRLGRGSSESKDLTDAVNRFRDLSTVGATDGSDMSLMVYTARRALGHVCDMLGLDIWTFREDGTKELNDLGRQLVSDEKVANFLVRLVHEYSVERMSENDYELPKGGLAAPLDDKNPAQFASADYVMGRVLAGVLPSEWTKFCRGRAETAKDYFLKAAEDLEARAAAIRSRFPGGDVPEASQEEARRMELQAATLRHRAAGVVTFVNAVMNGEPLKRLIPAMQSLEERKGWTPKQAASNYYGYILQFLTGAARMVRQDDGSIRYEKGSPFGFQNEAMDFSSKYVQEAVDAAAKALGVAQVVRRYVQEAGVDQPAPGESADIPVAPSGEPAATPAPEGVMEPDLTPQLVLQLPGSWQASDLQKQFYGGSFRDMMTDASQNAAAEETNRFANSLDFYIGANCMEGESVNEIEEGESDLGLGTGDQAGLFTVEERNRHSMMRVAAVRGHLLGLVNRAAKTRGRPLTREDVNLIHYVGQMVACMANGHGMYTGYDIPYVDRNLLDKILADVEGVEDLEAATRPGGAYSPKAVAQRVDGHLRFEGRPSNLDVLLNRILVGVPRSVLGWVAEDDGTGHFRRDGIYCKLLTAFYITARQRTANGGRAGDADFHKRVTELLVEAGIADKSAATGRVVLVIPAEDVKRAWEDPRSIRTELIEKGGRRAELLDMDYLAECVAAEANRLNRIAGRSRWLTDSAVGGPLSGMARGLWFEAGTGHHQAIVDHMKNARELFRGDVSPDEKLRSAYGGLQDTLASHARIVKGPDGQPVKGPDGREMLYGDLPAFELGRDGRLANISNRQLMYLGRLLGLGRRIADVDTFVRGILAGNYTKAHTDSIFGFDIRPKMTVFEFDRLMFDVLSAHLVAEAAGRKTPLTAVKEDDGLGYGRQELIDVYELHGRLQAKLMDDMQADSTVRGRVCSMSEQDMFRTTGKLGSSKSATERLRSMAEAITHAERFRGCLAQMLTTVGTDGAPNFVVMPKEGSEGLLPDEFWQATARFVLDRLRPGGDMVGYDATKSGFENMRDVAKAAKLQIRQKSDKKEHARYHSLPPDDLGAGELFEEIWCADDEANDDVNVLTKFANGRVFHPNGSEAEGYLRQLFGSVASPSVWSGWKKVDRAMSYSKAASVGLSAFFAVATRFESPIAACGFWNTVMGYSGKTAKLTRWLAGSEHESVAKAAEFLGFAKNMPYLSDFLNSITSDDPSIQYMRELCDLINMPLTDSIMNPLTSKQGAIDADIDKVSRWLAAEGHVKMAAEVRSMMKAAFHNPGEYAFSNVLNGVKMAVVAQTMFRLRKECEAAGRPFDPVRELRRHSAYINAEIGGIQPERYAFLTPGMQQLLRMGMFSYQWTLGAWVAGTGEVVSDMLFGGHHTTAATRQRAFIRWLRMLGIVKIGVPVFMQLVIKSLATALVRSGMVGDPDDPDDKDPLGIDDMPWLCFFNESKVGSLAFDVTPLTKLLGRSETLVDIKNKRGAYPFITTVAGTAVGAAVTRKWWGALAGGFAGRNIGAVIPASEGVGRGANTTGRRRQYMHFGKQNDEFWRWFTDGYTQATNKLSIPLQKVVEAFFGSTNGQNFGKKFDEKSITERFFTTSLDPNESALANFVTGFMPFSAASVAGHPDTGVLGMFGPVNQGTSKTRSQKEIRKILTDFVRDDRHNDPWSFPGNRANLKRLCTLVMKEARMNGLDPDELLTSALGQVTSQEYIRLFDALPKTERDTVDARKAKSALRALYRVNRKRSAILQSLKKKYKAAGVDWTQQKNVPMRAAVKAFLSETAHDPWVEDEEAEALFQRHFSDESERTLRSVDVQQDRKGGEAFSNFLATDDVPETLFGIPVVSSGYTQEDLEFFKRNPKAAGFYDLGDEGGGEEPPPEEPPPEGGPGPEQGDLLGGVAKRFKETGEVLSDLYDMSGLKKRVGETGEVADAGIAWMERQAKQTADMDVPVLSKVADAVVQPALVGTRAAIANATSGGGKYYQPEVRDERYFSEAALRELGESVKGMHGRAAGRADGMDNAAQFNLTQTLGGFTVKDGAVTDKFDINKRYHGVPDWATNTARAVLGAEEDPDKGKVKTRIPLKALRLDAKGGKAEEFMKRNPSLFSHVKSFEKMREKPYEDVGGYAIGYGAHTDKDGKPVTRDTAAIEEAQADSMLARDLYARREALAKALPNWDLMPGAAKQALLDVSMGRDDVLSMERSPGLHEDLAAAGRDAGKLLAAVKKHYYSYRTSKNPEDQAGLEARRVAGGKLFFGEDFSYDGKTWDPKAGFVKKGGK